MTSMPLGWEGWNGNLALLRAVQATLPETQMAHAVARILCEAPLGLCITLVAWSALVRRRYTLGITVTLAAAVVLGVEAVVARYAPQPRPFVVGWATIPIAHVANNALPSTHVALALVATGSLLLAARYRDAVACLVATLAMMWARVATGLHWPLDMLAAALAATVAIAVAQAVTWRFGPYLTRNIQ